MRVEAYRIGPGAEGYDEGFRFNVDLVGDDGRVEHRWGFLGREATKINAILEAGKHPCEAWWVEGGRRLLICTADDAEQEFVDGNYFRRLVSTRASGAPAGGRL